MNPIRLRPVYQRDVLSFLPREKLDKCALVSRSLYSTIALLPPASIPRRHFPLLHILCTSEQELRRVLLPNHSEFTLTGQPLRMRLFDQCPVTSSLEECEDCEELKEIATGLVGELVFVNREGDLMVGFKAYEMLHSTTVCVQNRLIDASAAFNLLHFLQHLNDAYFDDLLVPHSAETTPALNAAITRLLGGGQQGRRHYRLHCVNYMPGEAQMRALTADEVTDALAGKTVLFRRFECTLFTGGLDPALEMVLTAGEHCDSLKFIVPNRRATAVQLEQIIEFFMQRTADELEGAVAEVEFCFGFGFHRRHQPPKVYSREAAEKGVPEKRWLYSTRDGKRFRAVFTWEWSDDVRQSGLKTCSLNLLFR